MAIYKESQLIGFSRYEPTEADDGVLFSDVFAQGEANNLKELKNGDTFKFRNERYKIIDIGGGKSGNMNGRWFDLVRRIKAEKQ